MSEQDSPDLNADSGGAHLCKVREVADDDVGGLLTAFKSYGDSWKRRGGVGAFMQLARKWDRLELQLQQTITRLAEDRTTKELVAGPYDIFAHIANDPRPEGIIDDIRDLRRYLMLVESEMLARGFRARHRDNA